MNSLEAILDIVLITYNRKELLEKTFEQIFGEDSPIKNFPITILNNKSTDGTYELIEEYRQKFPNIKHIVNKRNIGGNANIVRAFETVSKKYFWILCDDDEYDWTYWNEIEEAIYQDKDVILTEHLTPSSELSIEVIMNELNFLPAGIYKSEILTDDVIHNAYANIYNSLPHQALAAEVVNENYEIFIPQHTVIKQNICKGENCGYKRGYKKNIHFRIANFNLFCGMINSYQMINDLELRDKCCGCLYLGKSFKTSMQVFLRENDLYFYNICDIFNGLSIVKKLIFSWVLFVYILKKFIMFSRNEKGVNIVLFRKYKTRILPRKLLFWIK